MTGSASERIAGELRGGSSPASSPRASCSRGPPITRDWHVAIATATRGPTPSCVTPDLADTVPGVGVIVCRPELHPGPRRRARYVRMHLTAAAVAIADSEGLEAVSIRRLAVELDAAPMSLYGHVPTRTTCC